jgi:hypothetical protein
LGGLAEPEAGREQTQPPTVHLAADLARVGLISSHDAAAWIHQPTAGSSAVHSSRRPKTKNASIHLKFLESGGTFGLSASTAVARRHELEQIGIAERKAATLAIELSYVNDVKFSHKQRDLIKVLSEFGVNVYIVLKEQPATIHIPVKDVVHRLESLVQAGFTKEDVATIV